MANLPPGWEPDYDGSRWLYRYLPTGLTQFTFPKPGDEFPAFVAPGAGPLSLAPEERLASEKQIKLRKKGVANVEEAQNDFDRDGKKTGSFTGMSATGYFDPSEFMYYGEGGDDGELTPIAGKDDNHPKYPLGFVAELPSNDSILCADELAPVELDAGQYESMTTSQAQVAEDSLIKNPLPHGTSPSVPSNSLDDDDLYSADTPTKIQPNLKTVPRPSATGGLSRNGIEASAAPVNVRKSEPTKPQSSLNSPVRPVSRPSAEIRKPTHFSGSSRAMSTAPLVSISSANHVVQKSRAPGRSVDDIRAMPSSLQAQQPLVNRLRSKSAAQEPWRPSIKFVQTGIMQESQVSTPGLSGSFALQQQTKDLGSNEDTRMSAWLVEQALTRPPAKANETISLGQISSGERHPEASAQHQDHNRKQHTPAPEVSDIDTEAVARNSSLPHLSLAREPPKDGLMGQGDDVVETVIDVPVMEHVATSRGVQLVDVSPGLPRSRITRRGAEKNRFSWEMEADHQSGEVTDHSTVPQNPTSSTSTESLHRSEPSIPGQNGEHSMEGPPPAHVTHRKEGVPQSVASAGRHQDQIIVHPSPKASRLPSPRLPFETIPPTHGQITANKVVVVKPKERRKASIATIEAGLRKPLPPLPLAPRSRSSSKTTSDQPRSNAFEQVSELIEVTNAAMPSAGPRLEVTPGTSAESVWRNMRTQASRSALSPNLTATYSSTPSTTNLGLPNRTAGRVRSFSQLPGPTPGLQPPERRHSRSQSLTSPSDFSPANSRPSRDNERLPQALTAGNTAWPKLQVIPAPTDGHKSHKRLSIHTTPAGVFQYHPLRSSPVFAPTSNVPEIEEPQPVDYIKDQTSLSPQPKPTKIDGPSKASRVERPRLQVKPPFVGLPSSPRPSAKPSPKPRPLPDPENDAKSGIDESARKPVLNESIPAEQSFPVAQRHRSIESQISSPTSSIFSSLRDSSVSATSSLAYPDSTPLTDIGADIEQNQVKCVQHSDLTPGDAEESRERMATGVADNHTASPRLSASPTGPAQAGNTNAARFSSISPSAQRPPNVPEAIRPAGTRASLWGPPNRGDESPDPPLIPTVIVRAPTVKLSHWERQITRDEQPDIPYNPKLPLALPERDGQSNIDPMGMPAQPVVNVVQSNDDVEKPTASTTKPQGFMQSLRKSWQFTTSNAPRLSSFASQGHTRSKSQSNISEQPGKVGEAIAMAAKQAVLPWQWSDRDKWPSRDSLPVDTGSIGNVGATVRFFNASFQARRSKLVDGDQPGPELPRVSPEGDSRTATIVVRKVGPPVVVHIS